MRGPRSNTRDEFDNTKDAIRKLRTENRKLRKENGRLRKELNRQPDPDYEDEEEMMEAEILPAPAVRPTCPKCKSENFTQIPAGIFLVKVCKDCKFRHRVPAKG